MRRIFTSTIFVAALAVASFNSNAQTCTVSTTNPNPTPAYQQVLAITSPNGFSTPASPANIHQSTLGTWDKGDQDQLFSPVYNYNGSAVTAVNFKVDLALPSTGSVSPSYTIRIIYGVGGAQNFTCSGTWAGAGAPAITTTSTPYYFTISGISLPATNFKIILTLSTASSDKDVIGTNFQANAQLAPAGAALPVKFQSLDARSVNSSVSLKWNVATEQDLSGYSIERSTDGRNFSQISFVGASGESNYSFVDSKPTATAYYRIKSVDINGRYGYSTVALVKSGKSTIVLKAFPSPVIKSVSIQHPTAIAGTTISVSSADGRIMKTIVPAAGMQQTEIDLSAAKAGLYLVRFNSGNGESETLKILKQ